MRLLAGLRSTMVCRAMIETPRLTLRIRNDASQPSWAHPLFDDSPFAMLILEASSEQILAANPAACHEFRKHEQDLIGHPHSQLLSPVPASGCNVRYLRADGTEFRAHVERIAVDFHGQPAFAVMLQDQTGTIKMRRTLTATLRRLEKAQEITRCGSWDWNIPENLILLSRQAQDILGLVPGNKPETLIEFDDFIGCIHLQDRSRVLKTIGEAITWASAFDVNYRVLKEDGEIRHIRLVCQMSTVESGIDVGFFGTVQDITDSHRAARNLERHQQELQKLAGHLQDVRENERKRISRELHDQLGQLLTVLRMGISWVEDQLPADTVERIRLGELKEISDSTLEAVRRIINDLRPPELNDFGLVETVRSLLADLQDDSGTTFLLHSNTCTPQIPEPLSIGLFRLIQEACTNILRHSHADNAHINLLFNPGLVRLHIEDDGIGFPMKIRAPSDEHGETHSSFGILGMRERIRQMQGTIRFGQSALGGAGIFITVPFEEREALNDPRHPG